MERSEYLKEIELTLSEIIKDEETIQIIKECLEDHEKKMVFNSFRYGRKISENYSIGHNPKAGEEHYNKIIKIKKARNLIDYLILLQQNKDK